MEIIRKTLGEIMETCDRTFPINPLMGTLAVDFRKVDTFTWVKRDDGSIEILTISFIKPKG